MDSSKISALFFICMLFISSATPILGCGYCGKPHNPKVPKKPSNPKTPKVPKKPSNPKTPKVPIVKPPVIVPPIVKPPVTVPPITVPPIVKPIPPITVPPIVKPFPPITVPPIVKPIPPITVPPITKPPSTTPGTPCQPKETCPIDTLKLGACVDLLGGLVHVGIGDPVVNQCCPVLQGLVEIEAAVCLCTTLKLKLLNLNIFVPLALQLLITCGKTPPPGFTCSI